ncbi:mannitol dehydrogenase family protein [Cellulomonas shaoxiangyii]|uniref:Mannitol-1-phosphate 5-dehydrogenase n=1 Tax=Cellulomonas shaoxiangyii TaxID=2566013 RepID=A0A4P7SEV9_9CELL|nr:mannitol dehydrogenase family protein [Cellulomonas shaoxiangyii]QCB92572.1 mannitol dehydrogenase family protein [Cellulomonas shaoxiangyii]TGY82821.1 mannitol dehydrogenase family protein [Cellulomonas shaoxiangyii]
MTNPRLSLPAWRERAAHPLPDAVRGPAVDPAALTVGQVHLGLGAFTRAHQVVCTEDAAAATGETGWGVLGVTQRSPRVAEQLVPQDGLYGVLTAGADATSLRLVGSVRDVAFPGRDTARVLAALAAPTTHVVTLTVTEKGYRRAAGGGLDVTADEVAADLADAARELSAPVDGPARTPVGMLVRGLVRRHASSGAPLTVVCCDNLTDNGTVLAGLVADALAAVPGSDAVRAWVEQDVRFPSTMVDRIVPATTDAHHAEVERLLGLRDEGLVVGEPFFQWVVEDDFAGPRPAWERAGATLTGDVAPYERAKLRVLNATHSTLAYLGALRGHATIAEAVADPDLAAVARALIDEDVLPTLVAPDGADLAAYRDEVLHRFANPATGHTTVQVAMDGSQKLPVRLLGTVADRLAAGAVPHAAATAFAAWVAYVRAAAAGDLVVAGRTVALDDPLAPVLARAAAGSPQEAVDGVLALRQVVPADVAASPGFRAAAVAALRTLRR